jgi:hypothetical protein
VVFGNKSVGVHLARGMLGVAALYLSLETMSHTLWPSLVLLPLSLYLLKGCVMCWTVGLIETLAMAVHERHERHVAVAGQTTRTS